MIRVYNFSQKTKQTRPLIEIVKKNFGVQKSFIKSWLRSFFVTMSEKSVNPYDMDGPTFDSDKYLQKVLKVSGAINKKMPQARNISSTGLYTEAGNGYGSNHRQRHANAPQ